MGYLDNGNIPSQEDVENLKRLCPWLEELYLSIVSGTFPSPYRGRWRRSLSQRKSDLP